MCNKIFFHHKSTHRSPQRSHQATIYLYNLYTCKKNTSHVFFSNFFSRPKVITNDCRYPFRPPYKLSTLYTCINTPHYTSQPFFVTKKTNFSYQKNNHRCPYWPTTYPIYMHRSFTVKFSTKKCQRIVAG